MPLLILDLDGTLVDSVPDLALALAGILAARGLAPLAEPEVTRLVGDGAPVLIERAFAARNATPDASALPDFIAAIDGPPVRARPFPGIVKLLDRLQAAGWTLAVCTNKPEHPARALLAALGLAPRFAAVLGGDSAPARKPDPRHVQAVLHAAGTDAAGAAMLGDHRNDIRAARGAGVTPFFAGWGYGPPEMAEGAPILAAPAELPARLGLPPAP
jgi:phosphoglycolate phosphatase